MARIREFEIEDAVKDALNLFWSKGYHASSVTDLADSTGLLRGSLYKAFESKHHILVEALKLYSADALSAIDRTLGSSESPLEGIKKVIQYVAKATTGEAGKKGCFMANTTLEMASQDPIILEIVERHYQRMAIVFNQTLKLAQEKKEISKNTNISSLSDLILCWIQGARIIGKTSNGSKQVNSSLIILLSNLK